MLLGILRTGDRRAAPALQAAGVTLEDARRAIADARVTRGASRYGVRHSLATAARLAREEGARAITLEHVLRGLLEELARGGNPGRLGVPAARVLKELDCAPGAEDRVPAAAAGAAT